MQPNMNVCINDSNNDKCYMSNLNQEATIDKTPDNFKKLTEIDGNLKGINRHLSYCNDKKFKGCFTDSEECANNIIINPQLYDREVAPTNMKKFEN
jgi:hypothetical protein